jgi:hypothetical protein
MADAAGEAFYVSVQAGDRAVDGEPGIGNADTIGNSLLWNVCYQSAV